MRVIVTGSRDWPDRWAVWDALLECFDPSEPFTLVHGGCPSGADAMANDWALLKKTPVEVFRADWRSLGKKAGPLRNQKMADAGADVCLAFNRDWSQGTADMISRAQEAGIPVQLWTHYDRGPTARKEE